MRAPKTQTETRKEQILQVTLDLIGSQGVQTLSIAAIAEKVGIVPSALYRHFKNKDAVLDGILELIKNRIMNNTTAILQESDNPLEQLRLLLQRHSQMIKESLVIPHVVFSDGIYADNPDRKAKVAALIHLFLAKIQDIIKNGQKQRVIADDIDTHAAAIMFLGMIMPAAIISKVLGGNFDITSHAINSWTLFERAISTK